MRTPNFWACKAARAASSSPDRPAGKPSRFSIRDDVPACPPSAVSSARIVAIPSDAPYTAAARPPGPAPTTSRSHSAGRSASARPDMPSASSSSWLLGLRSSGPPGTTTIGRSPTGTSSSRSIASASGDPSSSSHLDASRLRARTSSSRRVPASNRDPIRVRPEPSPVRIECRSKNVRRISSLRPSSCAISTRTCPAGTRSTRPAVLATALRNTRCPVSRPISPRNCDGPYVAITVSRGWPRRSMIRTSPVSTTIRS